jgi:hypothetical protein
MTRADLLSNIEEDAGPDYAHTARVSPEEAADDLAVRARDLETGSIVTAEDKAVAANLRAYAAELRLYVARSEAA